MTSLTSFNGKILFKEKELACKSTQKCVLAPGFTSHLIKLREYMNQAMIVTSCCRSTAYNQKIGGAKRSFHIYDQNIWGFIGSCAIDIWAGNKSYKNKLFTIAQQLGWTIGVYKTFLHLDRRGDYLGQPPIIFQG